MKRMSWLAALVVSLIVAVGPGSATAGNSEYPTVFTKFKYKLDGGVATFKGEIDSPKGGCIGDRKVKLYRKKNGNTDKLGGDHTDNKGKFEVDLGKGAPKDGKYYAEIKQAKIGSSGNEKTCLARTSPTLKLS